MKKLCPEILQVPPFIHGQNSLVGEKETKIIKHDLVIIVVNITKEQQEIGHRTPELG